MARVLYRDSQGRDGQVDLTPSAPLYVGRALDCAIRSDDAMVSRKHSMIRMEKGRFFVEDLGSSNGTHVNDVRVTKHLLNHNDVVRCGSLWLRFVEDGPMPPGAGPGEGRPKGATQRLEPAAAAAMGIAGAGQAAGPAGAVSRGGQGYGVRPASTAGAAPGGAMQGGVAGDAMQGFAYGGPAPQNSRAGAGARSTAAGGYSPTAGARAGSADGAAYAGGGAAGSAKDGAEPALFGGPPAMPHSEVGGELTPPPPKGTPPLGDEDSVVVDMSEGEAARIRKELEETLALSERLQASYDREVADGKRLRAEIVTHKDRLEELRRALTERDDVVEAHVRVADELREEIRQAKDQLATARGEAAEMSDLVAARERQLARSHEDIGQLKREMEDKERQLLELLRTKDEGWRKLNEQLTEIEHLREVINQQERMLEERRVGLISQDEIIKELRGEKELQIRNVAHLKAERDELKSDMGRLRAQVSAIDEENRRLTGLLAELRARPTGHGVEDHEAAAHTQAVSAELKTLRIALKTVEADRDHVKQLGERAEIEVERLRELVANLEVELREATDERERAAASKSVSDDAMTRAELARHKAAEQALVASKEREEALRLADEARRELDKAHRRLAEVSEGTAIGPSGVELELAEQSRKLERALTESRERIAALEAELRTARAEREAAQRTSRDMPAVSPDLPAAHEGDGDDATAVVRAGANPATIKDRAIDVHDSINDVLSELRNNAMILHEEFSRKPPERSGDSSRIMGDAIEAVLAHAEEAKGVLRKLRELVEFGEE